MTAHRQMMNRKIPIDTLTIEDGLYLRQTLFDKARRIVVKVGSAVLTDENGIAHEVVRNIVREICFLQKSGREVILVSSGAVAAGMKKITYSKTSRLGMKEKQALAAIGQSALMQIYEDHFTSFDRTIAQVLLTHSDLALRERYLNIRNTLLTLLKLDVIPVINENDTVCVEELRFGDNDTLGAYICNLIEADMFICLTDVNGLYNSNPETDPLAEPIYTVTEITDEVEAMVHNVKSSLGSGGMLSKIKAAKIVSSGGGSSFIGPGRQPEILQNLFSGKLIGTFFLPHRDSINSRKRWIATVLKPQGKLMLDDGAVQALTKRGKSLLPSGVKRIVGHFGVGDPVHCCNETGEIIAIGLINYSAEDTEKIKGVHTSEIESILGYKDNDEILHRDNLVIL